MRARTTVVVLLVVALPGAVLLGCSSGAENAATNSSPGNPLVGTWLAEGPSAYPVIVLQMTGDGSWTFRWGPTRDKLTDPGEGSGTYTVDGNTVTWLGGACDQGVKGTYTYTLTNGKLVMTATDEPCAPRRTAYDGITFTAETTSPSPSAS